MGAGTDLNWSVTLTIGQAHQAESQRFGRNFRGHLCIAQLPQPADSWAISYFFRSVPRAFKALAMACLSSGVPPGSSESTRCRSCNVALCRLNSFCIFVQPVFRTTTNTIRTRHRPCGHTVQVEIVSVSHSQFCSLRRCSAAVRQTDVTLFDARRIPGTHWAPRPMSCLHLVDFVAAHME